MVNALGKHTAIWALPRHGGMGANGGKFAWIDVQVPNEGEIATLWFLALAPCCQTALLVVCLVMSFHILRFVLVILLF